MAKIANVKKVPQKQRMLNGKKVTTVRYIGWDVGHGKYMTGEVDGKMVKDINGKPLPLRQIGAIV